MTADELGTGRRMLTPSQGPPAGYLPIAEHGIIGDLHSAALVGTDGTIDWYCPERFDGPSVFAALLDRRRGVVLPDRSHRPDRDHQAALPPEHQHPDHALPLPGRRERDPRLHAGRRGSREADPAPSRGARQRAVSLGPRATLRLRHAQPRVAIEPGGAVFRAPGHALDLASPLALEPTRAGVSAEFELRAGEKRTFVLENTEHPRRTSEREAQRLWNETAAFWRDWLGQSTYGGRWREMVHRSALTLKLLS